MDKLKNIDDHIARIMMMCLFLPEKMQVVVLIVSCAYFVYRTIATKQLPPVRNYMLALLIGGCYLLYVFAVPLTPVAYRSVAGSLCERRMSFLLIPLIFSFIAPVYRVLIAGELMYFVYATFVACVAANADYFYHYFFVNGGLHVFSHVDYRNIFENFSGIHPTYMGVYLAFSICIVMLSPPSVTRGERIVRYTFLYTLLVFQLALLAKSPIIALAAIGAHYLYLQRRRLYQFKGVFAGLAAVLAGAYFFIPFVRQRIGEMFGSHAGGDGNITNNSVHVRKLIFEVDSTLLKHYWLTGVGPGRLLSYIDMRYFFYSVAHGYWVGYFDPHNEYFSEWLSFGILGIICFVATLAIHFARAIKATNYLYLYLLLILCTTFFTETILSRQQGVLFYAVFTSLLFFLSPNPKRV